MVESLMTRPREDHQVAGEEAPRQRGPRRAPLFVLRRTLRRFLDERGPASASALAVLSVLAAVAGTVVLLGVLAVTGSGFATGVADALTPAVPGDLRERFTAALDAAAGLHGDWVGWVVLAVGAVVAVLAALGYVEVVRTSANRAWQVAEGRTTWRLLGTQLVLALAWLVLNVVVVALLVVTGRVLASLTPHVSLYLAPGDMTAWDYARWPLIAIVLVVMVTLLHRTTPNVRFERRKVLTAGDFVSIVLALVASAGLAVYLAWYPSWNATVGSVAALGAVVLWLWTVQAALVLGAHLDAEIRRRRELRAGLPAEERLQVPVRDDRATSRSAAREERAVTRMRELRVAAAGRGNPEDRPFGRR